MAARAAQKIANFLTGYFFIGGVYGGWRSYYWLKQVNDATIDIDNKVRYHPPTFSTVAGVTAMQTVTAMVFWPVYGMIDYGLYQKKQMGIIERNPPAPFQTFTWKKDDKV